MIYLYIRQKPFIWKNIHYILFILMQLSYNGIHTFYDLTFAADCELPINPLIAISIIICPCPHLCIRRDDTIRLVIRAATVDRIYVIAA